MCKIIGITNRHLCSGDYYEQIKRALEFPVDALIVREKDLEAQEYKELAMRVMKICHDSGKKCILHSFVDVALELKCKDFHMPLKMLREHPEYADKFENIGISVHAVSEAIEAEKLGAAYLTAGHIFTTDCKKDLPPRGLDFLYDVCKSVSIPVYAIGGITKDNIALTVENGAAGACVMSGIMKF